MRLIFNLTEKNQAYFSYKNLLLDFFYFITKCSIVKQKIGKKFSA